MRGIFYGSVCVLAGLSALWLTRKVPERIRPLVWLTMVLPFAAGGFYSFLSPPVCAFLLWYLWRVAQKNRDPSEGLRIFRSLPLIAVSVATATSLLSVFWGADRGMAAWGVLRFLPLLLYLLCLMQVKREERAWLYRYVPLCGAVMTISSFVCSVVPAWAEWVTVANRLSGFLEYPNTFAAFLLASLILSGSKGTRNRGDYIVDAVLLFGIVQSGSRTTLVLLAAVVLVLCIYRRERRYICFYAAMILAGVVLLLVLDHGDIVARLQRALALSTSSSSLLGRLLYCKDALGQIARHPLGLGYQGYYYTQGSFQTGAYSVMFVHNELLQLFLDVGWLATGLLCAAFAQALLRKETGVQDRLLLAVILLHSLMDFDLQFLAVWFLLLPALPVEGGKMYRLRLRPRLFGALTAAMLALAVWLGAADLLFFVNRVETCIALTPFHTAARIERLKTLSDPDDLRREAQSILALNDKCSIAYSALANVAYTSGDVLHTVQTKEQAIACNRYALVEYEDYIDKLCVFYQMYLAAGDETSARYCRSRLWSVPDMLAAVKADTSALAWRLDDQPELELPESYLRILYAL